MGTDKGPLGRNFALALKTGVEACREKKKGEEKRREEKRAERSGEERRGRRGEERKERKPKSLC